MVIGVILMVVSGIALIALTPGHIWLQLCALLFGAGVALTLDEFALILRLQDVYWRAEGRLSVDAVIVAVCAGFLFILGFRPGGLNAGMSTSGGVAVGVTVAVTVVINMCFAVVCLFKGKLWTGFFGVFIPIIGIIGATRLARPSSPWARKRYADKPKKLAKAQYREDKTNRTWRAWREAFFDLIAGKPHLPSLPAGDAPGHAVTPGPAADAGPGAGEVTGADGAPAAGVAAAEPMAVTASVAAGSSPAAEDVQDAGEPPA
jgi:hypothetical protein